VQDLLGLAGLAWIEYRQALGAKQLARQEGYGDQAKPSDDSGLCVLRAPACDPLNNGPANASLRSVSSL